jgi:hypothetical protein
MVCFFGTAFLWFYSLIFWHPLYFWHGQLSGTYFFCGWFLASTSVCGVVCFSGTRFTLSWLAPGDHLLLLDGLILLHPFSLWFCLILWHPIHSAVISGYHRNHYILLWGLNLGTTFVRFSLFSDTTLFCGMPDVLVPTSFCNMSDF